MTKPFDRLVIASHNDGKLREIQALLEPFAVEIISAKALDLPEPDETGDSFIANAELKALAASRACGLPALADDSGLCVNGLGGAPGIYSARWAGPAKDFGMAMARIQRELGDAADRSAYFICALSVAWADGHIRSFEGRVDGSIVWPARGHRGFGYDPIFQAQDMIQTFGEMDPDAKHAISHRARAFASLVADLFEAP